LPLSASPFAAAETGVWWSPGSAARSIFTILYADGYQPIDKPQRFMVSGKYGLLKPGEIERAQKWGESYVI
jgi:hypothetical protein